MKGEWQPIETAPRKQSEPWHIGIDKNKILLYYPAAKVGSVQLREFIKASEYPDFGMSIQPTHWMPRPEPPQ